MSNVQHNPMKLATAGALAFTAITGLMMPSIASASLVTGLATISIDNPTLIRTTISDYPAYVNGTYIGGYFDSTQDNVNLVLNSTPTQSLSPDSKDQYMAFPVQPATVPASGNDRFPQATTMDNSNTSVGQIGLSGAMLNYNVGPVHTNYLENQDMSLLKVNNVWNLVTHDSVGGAQTLYQLAAGYSEGLDASGNLTLSGNLIWGDGANAVTVIGTGVGGVPNLSPWANFMRVPANERNTVIGHLELNVSAVPVPGAVWLFGSALAGLVGYRRKKAVLAA
ncbi:MAG: hypothetical protein ABL903_16165 [Methylococcales bacterium]